MPLTAGTKLGPYEIADQIGSGGMGEVYLARDTRLGRDVAVKVLPEELSADPKFRQRFEREAKTISRLQHPNVCTLFDLGQQDGVDYLVMEYLEGETLEDRLREGALPVEETLRIGSQVASAVEAAHQQGIVHRDLKPSNVMLTKTGAKVLDFGLAREATKPSGPAETQAATAQAITKEGTLLGTMPYMAPELLEGKPASEQSDIWALGCILYEMATGERPFQGDTQASLIGSIMSASPEPPSRKQSLTPHDLDRLVSRCLEKEPDDRWQSSQDVALQLSGLPSGAKEGVSGRRIPAGVRWVAAPLAVLLALASWQVWRLGRTRGLDQTPPVAGQDAGRVAVLPFQNLTGDSELDALALGVPEEVISRFAGVVPAIARATSFQYRGMPVCEAAADMGVRFVLTGSLSGSQEHLRVGAQIIDCPKEDHVWAESFDQPAVDRLKAQSELGERIRAKAGIVLWNRFSLGDPSSPFTYLERRTPEDNEIALSMIRAGGAREPTEPVWVLWEILPHLQKLSEGWAESTEDTIKEMERLAGRCFELDAVKYLCYQAQTYPLRLRGQADLQAAAWRESVERSGEPGHHAFLGCALARATQGEEALVELDYAERHANSEVWSAIIQLCRAEALFALGRYEKAAEEARARIANGSNNPYNELAKAHLVLAASYSQLKRPEEAEEALARAFGLRPNLSRGTVSLFAGTMKAEHRARYMDGLRMAGLED